MLAAADYLANEYFPLFRGQWLGALFLLLYGAVLFALHHHGNVTFMCMRLTIYSLFGIVMKPL